MTYREAFEALFGPKGADLAWNYERGYLNPWTRHLFATFEAAAQGSGAGAQSDSGADSGHLARAVQSEGSTALSARLRAEALFIFDGPECSQDVRDVIEWFSGALAVAEAQEKT